MKKKNKIQKDKDLYFEIHVHLIYYLFYTLKLVS